MKHKFAACNGIRLHYVEAGKGSRIAVLLHGFPDSWQSWKRQISFLVKGGYRVIAPDLRGYNLSDKPTGIAAYSMPMLMADIHGLITHLGKSVVLVGHDWGGNIAWHFAMRYPRQVERLVILNCPHPAALSRILQNPSQLLRSWYVFFFQIPFLPEALLGLFWPVARLLLRLPHGPFDSDRRFGPAINYYRAFFRQPSSPLKKICVPVLVMWGIHDPYLVMALAVPPRQWVPNLRVQFIEASHWPHHEKPGLVNSTLRNFLKAPARLP